MTILTISIYPFVISSTYIPLIPFMTIAILLELIFPVIKYSRRTYHNHYYLNHEELYEKSPRITDQF